LRNTNLSGGPDRAPLGAFPTDLCPVFESYAAKRLGANSLTANSVAQDKKKPVETSFIEKKNALQSKYVKMWFWLQFHCCDATVLCDIRSLRLLSLNQLIVH